MRTSLHPVRFEKVNRRPRAVRPRIVRVDNESSSASCPGAPPPFQDALQYLGSIIGRVELGALSQSRDNVEPGGIPGDRHHRFRRVNRVPPSLWNVFARREPYEFMVGREVEPGLVQGYHVMPGSVFLLLEEPGQLWRDAHPHPLLIV